MKKTINTEMNLKIADLNSDIITRINNNKMAAKLDRVRAGGVKLVDDKEIVAADFIGKKSQLREKLAEWQPDLDLKVFDINPATKAGLIALYKMSKTYIGQELLIAAASKGTDSIAILFEKTNAALVGLIKPHLHGIVMFDMTTNAQELEALDTLVQQLIYLMFGNFIIPLDFTKNNKNHNWIIVNRPLLIKSIEKRLREKNLPIQLNAWESRARDMEYKGKTLFHVSTTYSAGVWRYLEKTASSVFTVGSLGTTPEECLTYLKSRKDYGSLCGTHKARYVFNKRTNKKEVVYTRVSHKATDKGKASLARIIDRIQSYIGKPIHLPQRLTGNSRLDYLSSAIGLNVHGSSWETAIYENYDQEVMDASGIDEIKWGIVTEIAKKKMNQKQAIKFFNKNKAALLGTSIPSVDLYERKLIQSYHDAINGVASGFLLGADGTNGGAQVIGTQVMEKVSSVDSNMGGLQSFYDMYDVALKLLLESGVIPEGTIESDLTRNDLKSAVQSWLYGAGALTMAYAKKGDNPSLWDTVGDFVSVDAKSLGTIVKAALENKYPMLARAIRKIGKAQAELLKTAAGSVTGFQWNGAALGTQCQSVNVKDGVTTVIYFIDSDDKVKQRTITRTVPDHESHNVNLPANLVHSLDAQLLMLLILLVNTNFITKHDDFRCHPNYMAQTRAAYVNLIVDSAERKDLENIASQALGYEFKLDMAEGKEAISYKQMRKSINAIM